MGPTAQFRLLTAATGMSVHLICLGNALKQSTPIVHAYRGEIMSQGGSREDARDHLPRFSKGRGRR